MYDHKTSQGYSGELSVCRSVCSSCLSLSSRQSPYLFQTVTNTGAPIKTIPAHLEYMVTKLVKDIPMSWLSVGQSVLPSVSLWDKVHISSKPTQAPPIKTIPAYVEHSKRYVTCHSKRYLKTLATCYWFHINSIQVFSSSLFIRCFWKAVSLEVAS